MKHTNIIKITVTSLAMLLLSACDSIPFIDNSSDYKGAGRARPLEVPPDLASVQTSDAYSCLLYTSRCV